MTAETENATETNGQVKNQNDTAEEETELDSAIIRQIEYYFGDVNLPRDKFLREQIKLDDGWIPLEILTRFNRLAKLTTDTEVIAASLNKSLSGLLEISEDKKKIRRSPEVPLPEMNEERRKEIMERTVYVKGFPKDSTLDDILKFFKSFEVVENIFMRKYVERETKNRLFKGSVFTTFKEKEQAEKFMEIKDHKYNETDLLVLWQSEYIQKKQEEYNQRKEYKDKRNKNKKEEQPQKEEFKLPGGTVFAFKQAPEKLKREDIKKALEDIGSPEIAYIDFKTGDSEGWVRLAKENSGKELAEKITDGKIKICDTDIEFKQLEEDEEKEYLEKTVDEMSKRRKNIRNNKFKKGNNFKGKYGKKRKHENHDDEPPRKVQAQDS